MELARSVVVPAEDIAERHGEVRVDWIRAIEKAHNQRRGPMKTTAVLIVAAIVFGGTLAAQERKPVPKNSVRVTIPGCTKGYIFTAAPRTVDEPGSVYIPPGMHLRMNGPKDTMAEIKAHEGSMIAITGIMKKGQLDPTGVGVGGGHDHAWAGPDGRPTGKPGWESDFHRRRGLAARRR